MVQVFPVQDRMGPLDALNRVDQLPAPQIENENGFVVFWCSEQPVGFNVNRKVIEISLNARRQLEGVQKFQRSGLLSPRPYSQDGNHHRQDKKSFPHFISLLKHAGFWSTWIAKSGSALERKRHHRAARQSIIHRHSRQLNPRSEEHTSELQSQ